MAPRIVLLLALSTVLGLPPAAEAVWTDLTAEQVQEAITHGKATYGRWRTEGRPIDDLDAEYVIATGGDGVKAMVFTEFATLALEARRWLAIGQELKPVDIERIAASIRGRLTVLVHVVGPNRSFLRQYTARLVQAGATFEPSVWEVFRGEAMSGSPERFRAAGQYTFRLNEIDPRAPAALVLRSREGHEISFALDLGRLR